MSQSFPEDFPIDPTTTSGTALAEILNRFSDSVNTSNSGASAPTETFPGMVWLDTSTTPSTLRIRNSANTGWDSIPVASGSGGTGAPFLLPDGTVAKPGLAFGSEPGLGWFRHSANVIATAAGGQIVGYIAGGTTGTDFSLTPRVASQPTTIYLSNQLNGAPNSNRLSMSQSVAGDAFIRTQTTGSAVRGSLTLDAPNLFATGLLYSGGSATASNGRLFLKNASDNVIGELGVATLTGFGDSIGLNVGNAAGILTFGTNGRQDLTIRNNGTVWVNSVELLVTNTAPSNGSILRMVHDGYADRTFRQYQGNFEWINAAATGATHRFANDGTAQKSSGAGDWAALSDARIKDVTGDYDLGLAELLQLTPRRFTYREGTAMPEGPQVGLIAQEVEVVFPEAVTQGHDKAGDIEYDDMRTLNTTNLTYALINAVKTLHERTTQLEGAPA